MESWAELGLPSLYVMDRGHFLRSWEFGPHEPDQLSSPSFYLMDRAHLLRNVEYGPHEPSDLNSQLDLSSHATHTLADVHSLQSNGYIPSKASSYALPSLNFD